VKEILTRELEAVGLRLNQAPPQIYVKQKHSGGVQVNTAGLYTLNEVDPQLQSAWFWFQPLKQ
jgi:ribosome-interacting GTPase 1